MNTWVRPVGRLGSVVYWRRRLLVGAVGVVGLLVLTGALWPRESPGTQAAPTAVPTTSYATPQLVFSDCRPQTVTVSVDGAAVASLATPQVFSVSLTNSGTDPCNLVMTRDFFELQVTSGTDEIWRTGHCADWGLVGVVTLEPGKSQTWPVTWPVRRSGDGCKLTAETLGPGTYVGTATYLQETDRHVFLVRR